MEKAVLGKGANFACARSEFTLDLLESKSVHEIPIFVFTQENNLGFK